MSSPCTGCGERATGFRQNCLPLPSTPKARELRAETQLGRSINSELIILAELIRGYAAETRFLSGCGLSFRSAGP